MRMKKRILFHREAKTILCKFTLTIIYCIITKQYPAWTNELTYVVGLLCISWSEVQITAPSIGRFYDNLSVCIHKECLAYPSSRSKYKGCHLHNAF